MDERVLFPQTMPCKICKGEAALLYTIVNKKAGEKEATYKCTHGHSSVYTLQDVLYDNPGGK